MDYLNEFGGVEAGRKELYKESKLSCGLLESVDVSRVPVQV